MEFLVVEGTSSNDNIELLQGQMIGLVLRVVVSLDRLLICSFRLKCFCEINVSDKAYLSFIPRSNVPVVGSVTEPTYSVQEFRRNRSDP